MAVPEALPLTARAAAPTLREIHDAHGDFVWASLYRMGARQPDLDDLFQEVFVVVHRKLGTFRIGAPVTPWLYGICLRVHSTYRRRAFRWRERAVAEPPVTTDARRPDEAVIAEQTRARLDAALAALDVHKRVVFVMFELDEIPCAAIAEQLGIPVGTVHSRLHAARHDFKKAVRRLAREAGA
ncbi:MAG: sigma-70 family RNA polymerase sigma factor [Polyangiaceae bacterium]